MLLSRTDELDAWYFFSLGIRTTPAPKPKLNANHRLYAIVKALAERADPGWLRTGATLLDASSATQQKYVSSLERLVHLSGEDGKPHTIAIVGGTRADNSFVLIWSSQGATEDATDAQVRTSEYLAAKKHQCGAALGVALIFDRADLTTPTRLIYDARRAGSDAELDREVQRLGLRPLERRLMKFPPPNKRVQQTGRTGRR
jgi:hypothetical protein